MIVEAILFLIVVLVVVAPLVQRQREEALARRLQGTRDPHEASLLVDASISATRRDERTCKTLRERTWPFLFRS